MRETERSSALENWNRKKKKLKPTTAVNEFIIVSNRQWQHNHSRYNEL